MGFDWTKCSNFCEFSDVLASLIFPFNYTVIFTLRNGLERSLNLDSVGPWITKNKGQHSFYFSLVEVELRV